MTSTVPEAHSASSASTPLDDYLALCKDACDGEIQRLYGPGEETSNSLYGLILDYPLRGGKALRPALSIATCLGLGGHLEAILPTAATLELYHNAFLIHDDIEDESWWRRGKPTLHIDHGVPIAVNVGDAMLSLSLQPLLDNVERIGLGPALRILRAVAKMTRLTFDGQAM
jgi:geranylgeranyl diphosphate synthase, type II